LAQSTATVTVGIGGTGCCFGHLHGTPPAAPRRGRTVRVPGSPQLVKTSSYRRWVSSAGQWVRRMLVQEGQVVLAQVRAAAQVPSRHCPSGTHERLRGRAREMTKVLGDAGERGQRPRNRLAGQNVLEPDADERARKVRQPKKPRRPKTVGWQRQCVAGVKSRLSRWPVSLRRASRHPEHHRGRAFRLGWYAR
jgi:hypothetical protein